MVVVSKPRAVVRTLTYERKQVGEGFALWQRPDLDPFLSFDEFEFSPPAGFLDHPHRGFESVTYMLEWMTAGRGVVHAEMLGGEGVQRGISIWINLSSKAKMVEPRYQETASDDIPVTDNMDGVSVKVIAAECLGVRSAVRPRGWSACAYVVAGEAVFEGAASAVGARMLVVFGGDGDGVNARAAEEATGATRG